MELRPPEIKGASEALVEALRETVKQVHGKQPNALGVIFYGSRTHKGETSEDSDVDLIPVVKSSKPFVREESRLALMQALQRKLREQKLRTNFDGCICVDDIPTEASSPDSKGLFSLNWSSKYIDSESVFIVVDKEAEQKIRNHVKPEERVWSRKDPRWG